ncbi:uncharacterized protein [Temnothorax longispinosus]|uniref:uncharacterized protein isoform X2 n=1 Tax=Temnothorax longispinosus TaxID=300112 RepID=UPI003A996323
MGGVEIPKKVHTCGICETILEEEEIPFHECWANYSAIVCDKNTFYLYPQCENGDIVCQSAIDRAEFFVTKSHFPTSKKPPSLTPSLGRNLEELIIAEVSARELLWNQKVNIAKRDRQTVQQLWEQVADATNGKCSVDEVKRKWKNLRNRYMKIISLEKLRSRSGSKPSRKKWKHYDLMSFLRDTYLEKETVSNITSCDEDLNNDDVKIQVDGEGNDADDASRELKRKRKNTGCEQNVMKQIAVALQTLRPAMPLPTLVLDEVDNFTSMVASQLRELPQVRRRNIMLTIHQFLHTELLHDDGNNNV